MHLYIYIKFCLDIWDSLVAFCQSVDHSIHLDTQVFTYEDFLVGLKSGHDNVDHPEEAQEGA